MTVTLDDPPSGHRMGRVRDAGAPGTRDLLAAVASALGPGAIDAAHLPEAAPPPPARVLMHDRSWPPALERGDLVLAVGADPDEQPAVELLHRAGAAGAAAVVVRAAGVSGRLIDAARQAGITLLRASPTVAWEALHAQIDVALRLARRESGELCGGVDLSALLDSVARMVSADVAFLDANLDLVSYSGTRPGEPEPLYAAMILHRGLPRAGIDALTGAGLLRRLWSSSEVLELTPALEAPGPHHAVAVRDGDEVIGLLWAALHEPVLADQGAAALRRAAALVARCVGGLSLRRHDDPLQPGSILRALLDGVGVATPGTEEHLGLEPGQPMAVLALRRLGEETGSVAVQRVSSIVGATMDAFQPRSTRISIGDAVYVLVSGGSASRPDRIRAFGTRLRWEVERALRGRVLVGVGRCVDELSDLHRSRTEADMVLHVLERRGDVAVATLAMVSGHALIDELSALIAGDADLRRGPLLALEDHPELMRTLRGYLDAFGDVVQAARALHIHPNTLRYRLRRLATITAIDLSSSRDRALLGIQLRAAELRR